MRKVKWGFVWNDILRTSALEIDESDETYAVTVRMKEDEALQLYEYLRGYFHKD